MVAGRVAGVPADPAGGCEDAEANDDVAPGHAAAVIAATSQGARPLMPILLWPNAAPPRERAGRCVR